MKKLTLPLVTFFTLISVLVLGAFLHSVSPDTTKAANGHLDPVVVTFYSDQGVMADGQLARLGACAAFLNQYPFGTRVQLFDSQNLNQPQFSCTIEDTGGHVCQNNVDVALPGQTPRAIQLGLKHMLLQVVGLDQTVAQKAALNHFLSPGCSLGPTH